MMTIKSDSATKSNMSTIRAWWKYSHCKAMTVTSCGIFWDFRNEKPIKKYISYVDNIIDEFSNNIEKLESDGYRLYNKSNKQFSFWIANKYYGWRYETSKGKMPLTIQQIAKVDNLLNIVEERK